MIRKLGTPRRTAALASSALVAGALTVLPGVAGVSAATGASAATAYTCDITLSGGFASYGGPKAATLTLDTDAPATMHVGDSTTPTLTYSLTLDPEFAAAFVPSPVRWMKASLDAATTAGATAGTAATTTETWDRGGGMGSTMPELTLAGSGSWGALAPTAAGDLSLAVGTLTGTLQMATTFAPSTFSSYPMTCTPDAGTPTAVDTVSVYAAPAGTPYTCDITMSGGFASYGGEKAAGLVLDSDAPTSLEVGASASPTLTASLSIDDAFAAQFKPSPVNQMKAVLTAATTTGSTEGSVPLTFDPWVRGGGIGSPVPALTFAGTGAWGEVSPTEAGDLSLAVGTLTGTLQMATTFAPTNFTSYPMTCTPDDGATVVDTIAVSDPEPVTYSHTCTIDLTSSGFGGVEDYDADVDLTVDAPARGAVGKAFAPTVTASVAMGEDLIDYLVASPVRKVELDVAAAGTAGTEAVSVPLAFAAWDRVYTGTGIGSPIDSMSLEGSGTFPGITPTRTGTLPISVDGLAGEMTLTVTFGDATAVAPIDCAANEGTEPATDSVRVGLGTQVVKGKAAIKGTPKVGKKLTVVPGRATGARVKYQWLLNGKAVKKATGKTMKVATKLKGKKVSVRVTYTRAGYKPVTQVTKVVRIRP